MNAGQPTADPAAIGVVGAGTMGAGIAQVAAVAGHTVTIYDVDEAALDAGRERIRAFLDRAVEKGRLDPQQADTALALVGTSSDLGALAEADVVIEAAPEVLDLKKGLFARLEAIVDADAILATNTSTLSVSAIASGLKRPRRAIGMHFFNPAPVMPLVEIIRGQATSDSTVDAVSALAREWGKTPIVASDTPGFIVNRVARPYYGEALRLVGDGVASISVVDRLCRDAGFPMGPFELMDLIGIDVNLAAATSVYEGFFHDPRFRPHPIQRMMVQSGRLGRKTGEGYYTYGEADA